MKNLLLPNDYLDPEILANEEKKLFQEVWCFVGLFSDIPIHNDYFLTSVGGKEVVVQNFDGTISAFTNTCSHRFSAIRTAARGNGLLQCPYHRWTYNVDGIPVGIPQKVHFKEFASEDPACYKLERWQVALCGKFVFIKLSNDVESLATFLGSSFQWLERMAHSTGEEFDHFEMNTKANWKVLLQNTLEFYHIYSVHQATFVPMVANPPAMEAVEVSAPHLQYFVQMREDGIALRAARKFDPIFARTSFEFRHGYEHLLTFPATTFGHTNGRSYSIFQYFPLAPDLTKVVVRHFLPVVPDLTPVERRLLDGMKGLASQFTRQLAREDSDICETVQRGLKNRPSGTTGILSEDEFLLRKFQACYLAAMQSTDRT